MSTARNIGIKNSCGKYVAFLDGDDVWLSDKLSIQKECIIRKNVDWIFSNYYVINERYIRIGKRRRKTGIYDYRSIISNGNPVGMLTVAVKRSILADHQFENVHHEDYDLWIRISKSGYLGYLCDDYLAYYMKSNHSISSNKIKSMMWTYKIIEKNSDTFFESIKFMFRYCLNIIFRKK